MIIDQYMENRFSYLRKLSNEELLAERAEAQKELDDGDESYYYGKDKGPAASEFLSSDSHLLIDKIAYLDELIRERGIDESSIGENGGGKKIG